MWRLGPCLDVEDFDVGVEGGGEAEGRIAGVDDAELGAKLLPVERHCIHCLEGMRPAFSPKNFFKLNNILCVSVR